MSKGCGEVQIKFTCVKPYAFEPGEVGNEVMIDSIYTATDYTGKDSSKSRCVYLRNLAEGESAYFRLPYFMTPDGEIMFEVYTKWKLYKL